MNAELIKAMRCCGHNMMFHYCDKVDCPYCQYSYYENLHICNVQELGSDAADALEAAEAYEEAWSKKCERLEKRIAELESNNPIVESVLVDKLNQQIDELENDKTNLEAEIINLEIALDKAHCELVRCRECNYGITGHGITDGWVLCSKPFSGAMHRCDWFCADGERKEKTDEQED